MNVATILKQKGRGVFTTTSDKSLLDIAKLLQQLGAASFGLHDQDCDYRA